MTTSKRLANRKVERFQKNITKRGPCLKRFQRKGITILSAPYCLVFSCLWLLAHIIRTATSGAMA